MLVQRDPSRINVNGRHLCGASRSGPAPRKLDWRDSARSSRHPSRIRRPSDGAKAPEDSITARFCVDDANGASGDLGLCSWIAEVAEISGSARRSIAQASGIERAGDGRRSGPVKSGALDGAAKGGGPWGSCRGGVGRQIPKTREEMRDRERQRRDDDLPSGR
jgi:hypothetical protein